VGWAGGAPRSGREGHATERIIISHAPTFAQKAGETALAEGKANWRACWNASRRIATLPECFARHPRGHGALPDGRFTSSRGSMGLLIPSGFAGACWRKRVGLAPGVAFGEGGEGSFRICYAEKRFLEPAMERLTKFLRNGVHA
jgi:aspartate/methionine/tyrosine aminotransferase